VTSASLMLPNTLDLRSFTNMREETFFVPKYQRGYRWTSIEVRALLEDVLEFTRSRDGSGRSFYCLQPVVVTRNDGRWEVIDGQQRLTTLYLVVTYINNGYTDARKKKLFTLEYETREDSAAYLKNPRFEDKRRYVDFHYIHEAYAAIGEWFADKEHLLADLESAFLNQVKVIWYEVRENIKATEVFARLNMGKIPLTDAELVKALFLRARNFATTDERTLQLQQLQMAQEWDEFERRLQDDEFWYFLSNSKTRSNRIELLLQLRSSEFDPAGRWRTDQKGHLFLAFNDRLQAVDNVADEWRKIKHLFLLLDEWFRDRSLYHLIGFRVFLEGRSQENSITNLLRLAEKNNSKAAFRKNVKHEIFQRLFRSETKSSSRDAIRNVLADLSYGSDRVRSVLLLFNLASLTDATHTRFPFHLFKNDEWDIEHIRSVRSAPPERPDDQKLWLDNFLGYLSDADSELASKSEALRSKVEAMRNAAKFDPDVFLELFKEIVDSYDPGWDPETDNSIGNLTLLDAATNRSYKNAIFPIKRREVIALDKAGKFVPQCTRNVFLKYYSSNVDQMLLWTRQDSAAHRDAMIDTLARYIEEQGTTT
jgi:hypothetical protein